MKYLSLFSGIGGFEMGIHSIFPNAVCVGYSEIKPHALKVYQAHFPHHKNLGDITEIKEIGEIPDLIVGGFPCTNLSSLSHIAGDSRGLEGSSSKLFYEMTRIIKICLEKNPNLNFVIENNASMSKANRALITSELEKITKVYLTKLDGKEFGVQCRNRLYWTTFPIQSIKSLGQTWKDVLIDSADLPSISEKYIACMNRTIPCKIVYKDVVYFDGKEFEILPHNKLSRSRWQCSFHSDTADSSQECIIPSYPIGKCRPITGSFGNHNVLVDRRYGSIKVRLFELVEIERLFGFPDGYTKILSTSSRENRSKRIDCLGNSVIVPVIKYILSHLQPSITASSSK